MNIFSVNSPLGRFLNLAADIVIVNFLWLLCSIPIITIGASTSALYYALMKRQRRDEGYIHTNFWKGFKDNLKQGTIIWLIMLAIGFVLTLDLRIGIHAIGPLRNFMIVSSVILMIPYVFTLLYVFPVQAKFENKVMDNIKNAFLMSIAHLGYTLLALFFLATFVVLSIFSHAFLGIVILCGMGLFAYLTSNIYIMVFRKHLPDELSDDEQASGMKDFF